MKKIIGFDSWTEGSHHYARLVPALRACGYELLLIHLGSWGHDLGRPVEEKIGELSVRDISYYKNQSFQYILEQEKPDAVIFLSVQAFAHRAFNRYCKKLKVPTLHLYHGLINVQSIATKRLNPINWKSQIPLIFSRLSENLFRILPLYAKSLHDTKASIRDWGWLANDIWRKLVGSSYSGSAAPDSSTTACCVYAEADVNHAIQRYRMRSESVYVVGNPDLTSFDLGAEAAGSCLRRDPPTNEVIYVDTALIAVGAVFDGAQDYGLHLKQTAEVLERQGYRLVVKLHPAHCRTGIPEILNGYGIEVVQNKDFVMRLRRATAAIVEPSSASIISALLGLPLFLAQYSKLAEQEYGQILTTYPRARYLRDHAELRDLIREEAKNLDESKVRDWIRINAGPLPAGRMPFRVAQVIRSIAENERGDTHRQAVA